MSLLNPARLLLILAVVALLATACSSPAEPVDLGTPGLEDVVYVGTNDEALSALLAAKVAGGQSAVVDMPADSSVVSAANPPTFSWHNEATAGVLPTLLRHLRGWVGIGEAYAHGTVVSGKAYFLVVASANSPKLLRVFTTDTSFVPSPALWAKVTASGGARTAVVISAEFDTGKITSDGGPFAGKIAHFGVAP